MTSESTLMFFLLKIVIFKRSEVAHSILHIQGRRSLQNLLQHNKLARLFVAHVSVSSLMFASNARSKLAKRSPKTTMLHSGALRPCSKMLD
jgi:hypothetical protein